MARSRAWDAREWARHAPRAVTLGLAAATRSVARHARDSVWRNMNVLSTRTEVCGEEGARAGSHGEIRNVYWYASPR
jgi:hypothetical protein